MQAEVLLGRKVRSITCQLSEIFQQVLLRAVRTGIPQGDSLLSLITLLQSGTVPAE